MTETQAVYQKQHSLAEIRHRSPPHADLLARIARLRERLPLLELAEGHRRVIAAACEAICSAPQASPGLHAAFALQSYVAQEISRIADDELPRYLFYRYRYEVYPREKIVDEFPPCLQVEPTSVCNYRCVFCYQTDPALTAKASGHMGMMTLDLFRQVIDQAEGRCEAVTLASRGEPLACRDLESMLAYAGGKFLALKLNTNASLLDERTCHAILQAGVNTVVFSADAAEEPAYSRFRVGGSLTRVWENVRRFREIRAARYPRSRTITRVSGVQVPGTPDLDEMERVWGDLVDQVAFVKYNPWENTYERPVNDIETPCSDLWRRMFVWWDGTVNPCDVDYRSTLAVGRIDREGLSEIWTGERYEALRSAHLNRRRGTVSPCNRCTVV